MAGRPRLRIGQHGRIRRIEVGHEIWLARCRFCDADGVTRIVERRGPESDQYGKAAEDALLASLAVRRPPTAVDGVTLDTLVMTLVDLHIDRIAEEGRAGRTIDTYRYDAEKLKRFLAGVRIGECTPARLDVALRSMRTEHGATMARRSRTILRGGLDLAVLNGVLAANPIRDVSMIRSKKPAEGAPPLDASQLHVLLGELLASDACRKKDLADPIAILIATGLRRSELLALTWADYSAAKATLTIRAKVVRLKGKGLERIEETKTAAGHRTVPLPKFAVETLNRRRDLPFLGEQAMIFPSTTGTWRDPDNFSGQWRKARSALGVPDVTSHSFRKSIATLIDDAGLSARIGADHLGHAKVSMTQDRYMQRGRVHTSVADLVEKAVISDE